MSSSPLRTLTGSRALPLAVLTLAGAVLHTWPNYQIFILPKHAKCEALGTDLKRELVIDVINYQIHHGLGNGLATFTASTI